MTKQIVTAVVSDADQADAFAKAAAKRKRGNGADAAKPDTVADDADHYTLASAFIDAMAARTSERPVYALGKLWRADAGLWTPTMLDIVAVEIGAIYGGHRYCRKGSDFNAIARIASSICANESFFDEAPIGIAAGTKFWRVVDGSVTPEPLVPGHRQRMRLQREPDFEAEAVLWKKLLDHAFGDDADQRDLLQILFGAALSRSLWRHRIAALLLGKTTTGKTTLLNVLKSMFPGDQVSATNPQKWNNEYYRATLAGSALNIVGELDANEPIPSGAFKSVVGCDVIEGRHPTHRPFSFVATASHFFNANRTPPTMDRSDAFFKRWRILEFTNVVQDDDIINELAERIVAEELPAVLAWMLEGAMMMQLKGSIPETPQHKRLLAKWRAANNSALQFILDCAACTLDPTSETKGDVLYEAYKRWAMDNGIKVFGRNNFFEHLDEGGGRFGVQRHEVHRFVFFSGVRLGSGVL